MSAKAETLKATLAIDAKSILGEGPFWHVPRQELFWFDIVAQKLHSATSDGTPLETWSFSESVAAAAVIDRDHLAIATETGLKRYSLTQKSVLETIVDIEADEKLNRANDSRVDRTGGFWIGTMRKGETTPDGAVYRYRHGALDRILSGVEIPNSICFAPDGRTAYFTDTPTGTIKSCPTDPETGLPSGEWTVFVDCARDGRGSPDGAVVDSEGYLWSARWGGWCVVRHARDGSVDRIVEVPASQVTCPAFGGEDLDILFVTTARRDLDEKALEKEPEAGGIFRFDLDVPGLAEPLIRL